MARDGLHVRVETTATMAVAYLTYRFSSGQQQLGGGEPLAGTRTDLILPVPPGPISIGCSTDQGQRSTPTIHMTVLDPQHFYRPDTLADHGCQAGAELPTPATAQPLLIGYIGSARRPFLVFRDQKPWATALVSSAGVGYTANLDRLCGNGPA